MDYEIILEKSREHQKKGISSAIGYASVAAAVSLNAKCIVTPSVSGATSRVALFASAAEIIKVTPKCETLRRMHFIFSVIHITTN